MKLSKKIEKTAVFAWSSILMFAGMLLAQILPSIAGLYSTFITGLVGLATAFFAGHVGSQWIASKQDPVKPDPKLPVPPKPGA